MNKLLGVLSKKEQEIYEKTKEEFGINKAFCIVYETKELTGDLLENQDKNDFSNIKRILDMIENQATSTKKDYQKLNKFEETIFDGVEKIFYVLKNEDVNYVNLILHLGSENNINNHMVSKIKELSKDFLVRPFNFTQDDFLLIYKHSDYISYRILDIFHTFINKNIVYSRDEEEKNSIISGLNRLTQQEKKEYQEKKEQEIKELIKISLKNIKKYTLIGMNKNKGLKDNHLNYINIYGDRKGLSLSFLYDEIKDFDYLDNPEISSELIENILKEVLVKIYFRYTQYLNTKGFYKNPFYQKHNIKFYFYHKEEEDIGLLNKFIKEELDIIINNNNIDGGNYIVKNLKTIKKELIDTIYECLNGVETLRELRLFPEG